MSSSFTLVTLRSEHSTTKKHNSRAKLLLLNQIFSLFVLDTQKIIPFNYYIFFFVSLKNVKKKIRFSINTNDKIMINHNKIIMIKIIIKFNSPKI